jgi:hypothetical protein
MEEIKLPHYEGLRIKKAKKDYFYIQNRNGENIKSYRNEHRVRTVLEIYEILYILQHPVEIGHAGGIITKRFEKAGFNITMRNPDGFLEEGKLYFFYKGTEPHTYHKETASITFWKEQEYTSVETPEDLIEYDKPKLLELAETLYDKLFPHGDPRSNDYKPIRDGKICVNKKCSQYVNCLNTGYWICLENPILFEEEEE